MPQTVYPNAPVRLIVPFPAGGSTDIVARLVANKLSTLWNANIVVENRAGASGMIGSLEGVRAPADGYTLTVGNTQTHGMNSALFPNPRFDVIRDVQPVVMLATTRNVIAVSSAASYQTVKDLIDAGRVGNIAYASVGQGSTSHLIGDFLTREYGLKAAHVPYRGASPAITDLIGGQIQFMAGTYGSVSAFHRAGKLRLLAIAGDPRDPRIPEVPTFKESGVRDPGLNTSTSIFAPAGTPRAVLLRWSDALAQVITQPDVVETLTKGGFEPLFRPLDEFEAFYRSDVPRLQGIIRDSGIRLE
jgi:tripartite-type tricarboxylate transporter receptor subunit TctC